MSKNLQIKEDSNYDERSTGGLVYRLRDGQIYWLVIKILSKKSHSRLGESTHRTTYKFPKGHLNEGEVLKQAALREVEEEGQVKARIIDKIGSNNYIINNKGDNKKIVKKVTFFLMEYIGESNLKHYDQEVVLGREWLTFGEALRRLGFDSEKILLKKAHARLQRILK